MIDLVLTVMGLVSSLRGLSASRRESRSTRPQLFDEPGSSSMLIEEAAARPVPARPPSDPKMLNLRTWAHPAMMGCPRALAQRRQPKLRNLRHAVW